jgi:DNA polymerase
VKNGKKVQLDIDVAGVSHQFGWGGVHGAIPKYHGKGYFLNMDVASLYPSLMIKYNLHSRNMKDPGKYVEIYQQRLKYKAEKNPLQAPLKLVLNSTYGVMKDKNNALFDPLQANRVCVYGQLLLLDLIERLEPYSQIIQSNTDGVLVKMPEGKNEDEWYSLIDDIAHEWEERTGLKLEFDEYREIYQKDVNNYLVLDFWGHWKSKGAYVKSLSDLDYDLPIINKALVNYMVYGMSTKRTVTECNDLKEFQLVSKISSKYTHILHGDEIIKEKCIRIFASNNETDSGVKKVSVRTGKPEKISNSPEHCFIYNDEVNGVKVPERLDKEWYINLANKRLADFGVM